MRRHFLVIGAQRCGTTYLHSILEAHPGIAMARPAKPEPKVFLSDELTDRGPEWYDATYFAHALDGQVLGEKSTSYLEDPAAARRAARMLEGPGVVVVLRDPVERAVSNWRFSTDHGLETRSLADALADNLAGGRGWDPTATSVSPFAYLERGRYAEYLEPWLEVFPAVQVLFLQELLAHTDAAGALYAGLGVDPTFRAAHAGRAVNQSTEPKPALPAELRARLEAYFADSDAALIQLLGRDLPWSPGGPRPGGHHGD